MKNLLGNTMTAIKKALSTKDKESSSVVENNQPKEIKVEWLRAVSGLSQIYSRGLEMCFISKNLEQSTQFVLCKDFLHDAIMAQLNNKTASIYGFTYDPSKNKPIDLETTRIAVTNSMDKDLRTKIRRCIGLLNQVESELHLKPSVAIEVSNPPSKYKSCGMWIIEGSKKWMLSPPMLSLFTLLIRCGMKHNKIWSWRRTIEEIVETKAKETYSTSQIAGDSDPSWLKSALPGIENILEKGYANIFGKDIKANYPDIAVGTMHGSFGICGFATSPATLKKHVPHWFEKPVKSKSKSAKV